MDEREDKILHSFSKGILMSGTCKHPEMFGMSARLRSFSTWTCHDRQSPHDLAEAGFYYIGRGDCTRCFHCGGGLRNWLQTDSPWKEHALWFPLCEYLRMMKGDSFIKNNQQKRLQHISTKSESNKTDVEQKLSTGSVTTTVNDAVVERVLSKPCSVSLKILGFSLLTIRKAIAQVLTETDWDEREVSASRLAEVAIDLTESHELGGNDGDILGSSDNLRPLTCYDDTRKEEQTASRDMTYLREENERLRLQKACKVCRERDAQILVQPCGHLATCPVCSVGLGHCILCRRPVEASVLVYT